jgi:hypothetical protein
MIDDRYIAHFTDNLVPEAFARRHTAWLVEVHDNTRRGPAAFQDWVDHLVPAMINGRYPAGHRPVRIIIVEGSDGVRWRWDGDPCCQPSWLVDRVRDESRAIPDPWVFAIELPWAEPVYATRDEWGEWVESAEPHWVDTTWQATWYAEARGRGVARTVAGAVGLDYDPATGWDRVLWHEDLSVRAPLPRVFHRILYGHPSRRDHPLRGH